jgi:hypothetical protein
MEKTETKILVGPREAAGMLDISLRSLWKFTFTTKEIPYIKVSSPGPATIRATRQTDLPRCRSGQAWRQGQSGMGLPWPGVPSGPTTLYLSA